MDSPVLAETGSGEAQAPSTLQGQIGASQQAQQAQEHNRRDVWVAFVAGVFFLIILLVAWLFGG